MKCITVIPALAFLLVCSMQGLAQDSTAQIANEGSILKVNDKAADFTVRMVDGQQVRLSDLKGKVVLLNFWATWCVPCMAEFTEIPTKIIREFEGKAVVFLPVARGESRETVVGGLQKLKAKNIVFNAGYDPDKKIWDQYATMYIPKNYIIDQEGVIRFVSTGNAPGKVDALAAEIHKLLDVKQ